MKQLKRLGLIYPKNKRSNENYYLMWIKMAGIEIVKEGVASVDFFSVYCTIIKLENSFLVLFSDQTGYGLGTISLGSPPMIDGTKAEATPFSVFGYKHQILSKLITQMCSTKLRAPVLTLLFIKSDKIKQETLSKLIVESFNDALENMKDNEVGNGPEEIMEDSGRKDTSLKEPKRYGSLNE
jgi:hypothetical protein